MVSVRKIAILKENALPVRQITQFFQLILSLFRDYLICGGLPDSVTEYVVNRNVFKTREVQSQTYTYYKERVQHDNEAQKGDTHDE